MAKYKYDVELEAFRRIDNRGRPLFVNVSEAQRIVSLLNLGYSIKKIESKVDVTNPKCGATTVKNFIKNYKLGNITIPEDAPAPVRVFESITDSDRIASLEERISKIENCDGCNCDCKGKSWRNLWGLL